jgi:hypothetical protein
MCILFVPSPNVRSIFVTIVSFSLPHEIYGLQVLSDGYNNQLLINPNDKSTHCTMLYFSFLSSFSN